MFHEKTLMVSTRVNGWQYFRWMSILSVLTIWCSSLLEDARAILSG